jgi:hypothetical protein
MPPVESDLFRPFFLVPNVCVAPGTPFENGQPAALGSQVKVQSACPQCSGGRAICGNTAKPLQVSKKRL